MGNTYALVKNNTIVNIIVADPVTMQQYIGDYDYWIDYTNYVGLVGIGFTYSTETRQFYPPIVQEEE